MRRDEFSRRLMRESHLSTDDLIYPVFVLDGEKREEAVASMPGVMRQSLDILMYRAEKCLQLGVPAKRFMTQDVASWSICDLSSAADVGGKAIQTRCFSCVTTSSVKPSDLSDVSCAFSRHGSFRSRLAVHSCLGRSATRS